MADEKRWWISWYNKVPLSEFELHRPWWVSGARLMSDDTEHETVCAAVIADDEDAAKEIVRRSYDNPPAEIEWRFCNERNPSWSPFTDRFPRGKWMQWPVG